MNQRNEKPESDFDKRRDKAKKEWVEQTVFGMLLITAVVAIPLAAGTLGLIIADMDGPAASFLLALFTIACVAWFVLLVFPAVMTVMFRILDRLFGERSDR